MSRQPRQKRSPKPRTKAECPRCSRPMAEHTVGGIRRGKTLDGTEPKLESPQWVCP